MINDIMPQHVSQVEDFARFSVKGIKVMNRIYGNRHQFAVVVGIFALTSMIGHVPASAQQITLTLDNESSAATAADDLADAPSYNIEDETPLDLTLLASPDNLSDNGSADTATTDDELTIDNTSTAISLLPEPDNTAETDQPPAEDTPATSSAGVAAVTLNGGFRQQNPSAIRLASLGITLDPADGLDRMLWQGSDAATVLDLYARLPARITSPDLHRSMVQVALMRAIPPEGSIDVAEDIVAARLDWLSANVGGEDVAAMIRQLPDDEIWQQWVIWLVHHDLLQREDTAACQLAEERAAVTLDVIWHKINAFCMIINNELGKASFAIDILEDRGVTGPIYFPTMRQLTGGAATTDLRIEQAGADALDLVLLESTRVDISRSSIAPLDEFAFSLSQLRYLEDEAATLLAARQFHRGDMPLADVLFSWGLLPIAGVPAAEAVTGFSLARSDDDIAMARYHTWQALSLETDAAAAAQLAVEALKIDFGHVGSRSLDLWLPFITAGKIDVGPLAGLTADVVAGGDRSGLSLEARAWADILAFPEIPIRDDMLVRAGALDAVPLLRAAGLAVEEINWSAHYDVTKNLAAGRVSLPLARLERLEAAAADGRKAEAVMLAVVMLGDTPLYHLGRDDAARVVAAFNAAGLEDTARHLAADILRSWVIARHIEAETGSGNDTAS